MSGYLACFYGCAASGCIYMTAIKVDAGQYGAAASLALLAVFFIVGYGTERIVPRRS